MMKRYEQRMNNVFEPGHYTKLVFKHLLHDVKSNIEAFDALIYFIHVLVQHCIYVCIYLFILIFARVYLYLSRETLESA